MCNYYIKTASSTDLAYCKSGSLVSKCVVCELFEFNKKSLFLLNSSKELTSVVRLGKDQNSGYSRW